MSRPLLLFCATALSATLSAPCLAFGQAAPEGAASPAIPSPRTTTVTVTGGASVAEVVVTAARLDQARASIQPQIGASVYSITDAAIKAMPGGENAQLDQVILQAPGVVEDSFGQVHVRGEHNGLQYRLNGVILPEGLSVFGQTLDPHLASRIDLITGALPAQYGLRTAGIVDIATKSGIRNGGSVSLYGGSHGEINPSAEDHGSAGPFSWFVSASYLQDNIGIESPTPSANPVHDHTRQLHAFTYLEYILDPSNRLAFFAGTSDERFQIPNQVGLAPQLGLSVGDPTGAPTPFVSQNLNETQAENTQFAALSWLHDAGAVTTQVSLLARYSTLHFTPDPLGDLLFNGIAQNARKSDAAAGVQAEGVWRASAAHTLRGGIIVEAERAVSDTASAVLALGPDGQQIGGPPFRAISIVDDSAKTVATFSAYVQDEWKIADPLTLNYGLRFDQFDGYRRENQLSPRVNLVYKPWASTTLHAGFARYFSPPPSELVAVESVAKFVGTTGAAQAGADTTPYSERANYFDVGVSQVVAHHLTLGVDTYYKQAKNLVDEGQFGAPIILTPFNYAVARQYGAEFSASYALGRFTAYANFAAQSAKGKNIISSQFRFDPAALSYIASHYIDLDHSSSYTASGGFSYNFPWLRVGGDVLYGSGLRADKTLASGEVVPNGAVLPGHFQVNLTLSHRFQRTPGGPFVARLDVINAADRVIQLRNGSGIGVFAPQYGPRRGLFAGLTKEF